VRRWGERFVKKMLRGL